MKKETSKKTDLQSGVMTGNSVNTNSREYREAQAAMFNMIQEQTEKDLLSIEIMALQLKMKRYLDSEVKRKADVRYIHVFYKEMLEISQVQQNTLAEYMDLKANNLGNMFKQGKVNYKTAKILESIFKIQFSLWLDIQWKNEIISNPSQNKKDFGEYSLQEMLTA